MNMYSTTRKIFYSFGLVVSALGAVLVFILVYQKFFMPASIPSASVFEVKDTLTTRFFTLSFPAAVFKDTAYGQDVHGKMEGGVIRPVNDGVFPSISMSVIQFGATKPIMQNYKAYAYPNNKVGDSNESASIGQPEPITIAGREGRRTILSYYNGYTIEHRYAFPVKARATGAEKDDKYFVVELSAADSSPLKDQLPLFDSIMNTISFSSGSDIEEKTSEFPKEWDTTRTVKTLADVPDKKIVYLVNNGAAKIIIQYGEMMEMYGKELAEGGEYADRTLFDKMKEQARQSDEVVINEVAQKVGLDVDPYFTRALFDLVDAGRVSLFDVSQGVYVDSFAINAFGFRLEEYAGLSTVLYQLPSGAVFLQNRMVY